MQNFAVVLPPFWRLQMKNIVMGFVGVLVGAALVFTVLNDPFHKKASSSYERVLNSQKIHFGYSLGIGEIYKNGQTGELSGADYDFMNEIAHVLNLKPEWVEEANPASVQTSLAGGKYEVFCCANWPDPKQMKNLYYSRQFRAVPFYAFFTKKAKKSTSDLNWINQPGTVIATFAHSSFDLFAEYRLPRAKRLSLDEPVSDAALFRAVINGAADVGFAPLQTLRDYDNQHKGEIEISQNSMFLSPSSVVMSVDDYRLGYLVNFAMGFVLEHRGAIDKPLKVQVKDN
jgi:ABC-type amino acid transport substrate-binding protein